MWQLHVLVAFFSTICEQKNETLLILLFLTISFLRLFNAAGLWGLFMKDLGQIFRNSPKDLTLRTSSSSLSQRVSPLF